MENYFDPEIKKTAILVDGGFYRRRARTIFGKKTPEKRANELFYYCRKHIENRTDEKRSLYRIFYYDCEPVEAMAFHPLTCKNIDLAKTDTFRWAKEFINELKSRRKFAIRLGALDTARTYYTIKQNKLKELLSNKITIKELDASYDFDLHLQQKEVDMMIGLDIASLSYKRQVNQIILISGDSDFVPAAKLARREGIDFILDNMRLNIKDTLQEHIDGIQTMTPQKRNN